MFKVFHTQGGEDRELAEAAKDISSKTGYCTTIFVSIFFAVAPQHLFSIWFYYQLMKNCWHVVEIKIEKVLADLWLANANIDQETIEPPADDWVEQICLRRAVVRYWIQLRIIAAHSSYTYGRLVQKLTWIASFAPETGFWLSSRDEVKPFSCETCSAVRYSAWNIK